MVGEVPTPDQTERRPLPADAVHGNLNLPFLHDRDMPHAIDEALASGQITADQARGLYAAHETGPIWEVEEELEQDLIHNQDDERHRAAV